MPTDLLDDVINAAPAAAPKTSRSSLDEMLDDVPEAPKQASGDLSKPAPMGVVDRLRDSFTREIATPVSNIVKGSVHNIGDLMAATGPMLSPEMGGTSNTPPSPEQVQALTKATEESPLPITKALPPPSPNEGPAESAVRGVAGGLEGATSFQNLGIMAGTSGSAAIANALTGYPAVAAKALNAGLGAYFAKQMATGAGQNVADAYHAYQKGDMQGVAQHLGAGSVDGLFALFGLKHLKASGADILRTRVPNWKISPLPDEPAEPPPPAGLNAATGEIAPPAAPGAAPVEPEANTPPGTPGKPAKPPKPASVEKVSPATPNPPTAAVPTAPEAPETIALQLQQLGEGHRKAVMFPKGTPAPTVYPPGTAVTSDAFGNTYVFRPDLTNRSAIKRAAKNNTLPEILGSAEMGMGAPDKSALQGEPVTVVGRAPDGTEAQSTGTDQANLPVTLAATQHVTPPGGSVSVEPAENVIAERQQQPAPPVPPQSQTGLDQMGGDIADAITGNMYGMLWDKAQAGDVTEGGRPSALLQAAKLVRDRGGLQSPEEFKSFAQEYAQIPRDANFQQAMRDLVGGHAPAAPAPDDLASVVDAAPAAPEKDLAAPQSLEPAKEEPTTPVAPPTTPVAAEPRPLVDVRTGTHQELFGHAIDEGSLKEARKAYKPVLDLQGNPTGWLQHPGMPMLLHPTEDKLVNFAPTNPKSGSDRQRAYAMAHAYAIDHPVTPAPIESPTKTPKPVTPQIPNEEGTKYVLPSFVTAPHRTSQAPTEEPKVSKANLIPVRAEDGGVRWVAKPIEETPQTDLAAPKGIEPAIPDKVAPAETKHRVTYFTGKHNDEIAKRAGEREDIGLMVTPLKPDYLSQAEKYPVIAIDNGVFSQAQPFDAPKFRKLIERVAADPKIKAKVRFVVAPDVVGDADKTLEQFPAWADEIHSLGLPVAFAAQDGIEHMPDLIPWDKIDVLFIGGSTEWKTGEHGEPIAATGQRQIPKEWTQLWRDAKTHHVPVHMGRVNSAIRLDLAEQGLNASSVDGTFLKHGPDINLPQLEKWLDRQNTFGRQTEIERAEVPSSSQPDEADWQRELKAEERRNAGNDLAAPKGLEPVAAEEAPTKHEFASTQANLSGPVAKALVEYGKRIPDSKLTEDGRETESHVTVKYGLHGNDPAAVAKVLENEPPITATLGKTSLFSNDKADVLKMDVDSPDLHRLNKLIADALPHTDTHPDYTPHATIAYLKPGEGKAYSGQSVPGVTGQKIPIDHITFSGKNGEKIDIPLKGKPAAEDLAAPQDVEKPEKIEAHDGGAKSESGSGEHPVRNQRPETLAGISADHVPGPSERGETLPGGVGGGDEDHGSVAGTTVREGEAPIRQGAGDRVPGVVSPPGREGSTQPDVQSNPAPAGLANDFRLTPEQSAAIENSGARTKARNNLEAIRTIKQIQAEGGRAATLEEQHKLARYVGWGDSEFSGIFKNRHEWRGIREELENLLTPEEYDAAEDSTRNAHYTRRDVAAAMWDAAVRMGFRAGGSVVEPGMGIGNFFMMMPEDIIPGTSRTGIEKDLLTGDMARALFPGSNIVIKPYEKTNLPDGYFDMAIGNVPFADVQIVDPTFKRQPYLTQNVHNYFFAKSMLKLRPGGVMIAITSRYTMDGTEARPFRDWMSKEAELLGAIRLPRDTFKANAGTSVTVDMIALRKRIPNGLPVSDEQWTQSKEMVTEDGTRVNVNEYFHRHPEMMLGKMNGGTQYYRGYPELFGEFSLDKLKDALAKLPSDVIPAWAQQTGARDDQVENYPDAKYIKDHQFAIVNGALVQRDGAYFRPVPLKGKKLDRMKDMIELRGAARETIRAQTMDLSDAEILDARKDLNKVYATFIAKHGPVNGVGNALVFGDDPDWPVLSGLLEDYDKDAYKAVPKEAKDRGKWGIDGNNVVITHGKTKYIIAKKRPVFRERTNQKPKRIESVETAPEALAVSLNDYARIDWDRMQELTGRDPEELQKELAGKIFRNPITRQWQTADEYLSGNVRQKLKDAEFAVEKDPDIQPNVEALKLVQPPDKEPGRIKVSPGATWIPAEDYADFAKEVLRAEPEQRGGAPIVTYVPLTGGFGVHASYKFNDGGVANKTEYGTPYFDGMDLFEMALNGRAPVARDTYTDMDGSERTVKNPDATIEAVEKQQRLQDKFVGWIWGEPARAKRLARKYNDEINNLRLREYDGSHLTFPGLNKSWLRSGEPEPHQKNAVWRTIQSGNTLYAHVVGAGKTLEGVMAAMELRRLGLARKPMMIVPNHLVGQWRDDWMRAYPGAQILVPTKKDFQKQNRQRLMARIASGNYDGVIIGHKSFEKLPVSDDTFKEFVESQLKEIEDALDTARAGMKTKKEEGKDPTIKQLRRRKAQLEAKLEKRAKREEKDTGLNFEDLGVDQLFVDEADLFKNLGYLTMMDRIAGLPNSDSDRATDMLLKTQYVSKLHGGDRGVVFMTGTPVSNSIAEIWTVMRYLMPKYLEREGFDQFDSWAKTFGKTRTQMEVAPEGGRFIQRTRFAKFQNAGQMMNMFRLVADIKTAKQLNLPTPAIYKGGYIDVAAPASEDLKAYVREIGERADGIRNGTVKPEEDNMLKVSSDGRKASLDMRLVDPLAKEDANNKVNKAVEKILDVHREFAEHKGTQLLFLDLSTPKSEKVAKKKTKSDEVANTDSADAEAEEDLYGEKEEEEEEEAETAEEARERFTVYSDIRKKLIAGGVEPEEIAFIQDAKTDAMKEDLFRKMRAGRVRIMLGSTEKMGAGMNVQDRLVTLHHLDAPWRPRDMAQRDGRIVRQGNLLYNEFKIPVRLYRYMTEGSFDAFMWETLAAKAAPIEQLMEGDPNLDEVEELSVQVLSYEQAKALSTGNPLIREKIILDQDIHKLNVMRGAWMTEQASVGQQLTEVPGQIKHYKERIADLDADIATRDQHPDLVVDGKSYSGKEIRAEGAAALVKVLDKLGPIDKNTPIAAEYRGFKLEANPQTMGLDYRGTKKREFYVREKQADGKFMYYAAKPVSFTYYYFRDELNLKPLPKDKAEAIAQNWDQTAKDDKKWADIGLARIWDKPQLRLMAKSATYALAVNYTNPVGTIQSAEYHVEFEDTLHNAKDEFRRYEKKKIELEGKLGEPFQQEEKLRTMQRRQAELALELGEDSSDLQALRAAEEGEDKNNPLTPFLKDSRAAMHAKWFPQKKYFTNTRNGKESIKGYLITKQLAVHQEGRGDNATWTVDHIPSGRVVESQFPTDYAAVAFARQAAKAIDWKFIETPPDVIEKLRAFKKAFRAPTETPERSKERLKEAGELTEADEFYVTRGEGETESAENKPITKRAEGEGVILPSIGGALQPAYEVAQKAAAQFLREEVVPKVASILAGARTTVDSLVHLVDPRRGVPTKTLDEIYKMKGGRDAAQYILTRKLDKWGKRVDAMSRDEMVNFIDRMKVGVKQADPELQQLSDFLRQADDALYNEIKKHRPSLEYLENHFRVLWKVIPGSPEAKGGFKGVFRRPLQGGKGFLKQSKLADMSEGLELGGVPHTFNPIKMFTAHYADAMKFVTAQRLWDKFEQMGVRKFARTAQDAPEGYVKLDDRIANVYFPVKEGMVHAGDWYVEEGAARLLNNFLSRDLIREQPFGRALMSIKNASTAVELSISPFHAVFEGNEAVGSQIGIGLRQMWNLGVRQGNVKAVGQGLRSIATAPAAAVTAAQLGGKAKEAFGNFDEFSKTPSGQAWLKDNPTARQDVEDFFNGGGKIGMHEDYKVAAFNTFKEYAKSASADDPGHYISAAIRSLPALNQAIMSPLFEHYIPNLKLGFFLKEYNLAKAEYSDRLAKGEMTSTQLARQVVDSVENRFGEMNFDNLFWKRTFKTTAQLLFRSITWKLGNLRANVGAISGQWREIQRAIRNKEIPMLHPNMGWLLGMTFWTAVFGGTIYALATGKRPKQVKDFIYPVIDAATGIRVSLPTYWRDIMHLAHSPLGYVTSSLSGEIGRLAEVWQNKDFPGNEVWNADDPLPAKAWEVLKHLVPLPFSVSSATQSKDQGGSTVARAAGYLGFTKAPHYIEQTKAEQLAGEYAAKHRETGARTAQAAEQARAIGGIRSIYRRGGNAQPQVKDAIAKGFIKSTDVPKLRLQAKKPPLDRMVGRLSPTEALNVYEAATPEERKGIKVDVRKKLIAARTKPWEWTPQGRTLAQKYFGIRPVMRRAAPIGDFAAPSALQ